MKKIMLSMLLFIVTIGYSQEWKTNFEVAKTEATNQNKNILLVFSGSDWCGPCIKLDRDIWKSAYFMEFAKNNLILERADFPKKKQNQLTPEIKELNQSLAEKYNKDGMFPLVVVVDKNGKVLGKTGYKNVSPQEYVNILKSFLK
ncbi:thioredoxin family protein [Flavobacterium urumqiense]|uniref:Thiol-disulfide isomerase or thioredoxin n=1 Tax=Flavobacterium urumqiense TaxID=935224 RepID=A0A1H5WAM8_9FLAO|nr:thioredoxin family protein [Flavobacterium urumqiense]SEF96619.1 Thiol-disulfide isomerase or thioredoxin [Flavobacterium urumqiense]